MGTNGWPHSMDSPTVPLPADSLDSPLILDLRGCSFCHRRWHFEIAILDLGSSVICVRHTHSNASMNVNASRNRRL